MGLQGNGVANGIRGSTGQVQEQPNMRKTFSIDNIASLQVRTMIDVLRRAVEVPMAAKDTVISV